MIFTVLQMLSNETSIDTVRNRILKAHNSHSGRLSDTEHAGGQRCSLELGIAPSLETLEKAAAAIGALPPTPATLRGRLGRHLVLAVRRLLFWLIPSLRISFDATVSAIRASHEVCIQLLSAHTLEIEEMLRRECNELQGSCRHTQEPSPRMSEANSHLAAGLKALGEQWHASLNAQAAKQAETVRRLESDYVDTNARVSSEVKRLERLVDSQAAELLDARRNVAALTGSLHLLSTGLRHFDRGPSGKSSTTSTQNADFDQLYVEFEERFRGTEESVQSRLSPYLAFLANPSTPVSGDVLDIGCGRGEWLKLLRESGYPGVGIDSNKLMIARCQAAGLRVESADAVEYLTSVPCTSLRAVTAFHVVEHLMVSTLTNLLREAYRALLPGGLLLLETPNPSNLIVGSSTFYIDPTHRRPLPHDLLDFLIKGAGFVNTEVVFVNPSVEGAKRDESHDDEFHASLAHYLFGPQDYAIVARKGSART